MKTAGETMQAWLGVELTRAAVDDHFTVVRPVIDELSAETLAAKRKSVFILSTSDGRQIRGQMVVTGPDEALFVGSPVVNSLESIDDLGLTMTDFAPHDATMDMVVLQRFNQMQLADLEKQATELRAATADRDRFNQRANTDWLTGLANRRAFWDRCEQLVDNRDRLALLFIDVDEFKAVNDSHGHGAGDAVLRSIAHRLGEAVRSSDLVARLGGDEFAVLLTGADEALARAIVDRITSTATKPIDVNGTLLHPSLSVGVVVDPGGTPVDDLIQSADLAMYEGRQVGRGEVTWFAQRMRAEQERRRALIDDLERALDHHELVTVFQPIVRLPDRSTVTLEALARWTHPEQGPVSPAVFIEAAEEAGLIERLDLLMLRNALARLADWRTRHPGIGVQVNFSGQSIRRDLIGHITDALHEASVPPGALTVEVTESWLIRNESEVAATLTELADIGVRIHLDDFGTGYSSLTHLHGLPISGLKIDRSFVLQATQAERSRRLIAATIGMAHSLDIDVVAEGVETEAIAQLLVDLECDFAQGFLFSPPMVAGELEPNL